MRDDLVQLVTKVIREQQGCFFDDIARAVLAAIEAGGFIIAPRNAIHASAAGISDADMERLEAAGFVIIPREPTEAMIAAGAIYADHNGAHGAWQAMIDCALKDAFDER